MRIITTTLESAADELLETALLDNDWSSSLAHFSTAAGAAGATLVRDAPGVSLHSCQRSEFILATDSILEPINIYLTGQAPPDPRLARVSPRPEQGFQTDLDQFSAEELARNPFYEEFLRSYDLGWHACALIDSSRDCGQLYLSLKRHIDAGHYDPDEIRAINSTLPKIRMAAAISRTVFGARNTGMVRSLQLRGEAIFEFDVHGRLVRGNQPADALMGSVFGVGNGRLLAPLKEEQALLEGAMAAPLRPTPQVACIVLGTIVPDRRLVLRTLPVTGHARDVFSAVAALAIVTVWEKPNVPPDTMVATLRQAFDLTAAEAKTAALVGLGVTLSDSSRILEISIGTARNYFKAAQSKIGIARQAELASLIALMQV